ncbi:MAG: diphosphate--fructose-6-phosphate 1-phosphotransferase [Lentisphaeria bacterium]
MSTISPLEKARAAYQPKLPAVFAEHGPSVGVSESGKTESVADHEAIGKTFPNTYGQPTVTFEGGKERSFPAIKVGVVLSGGQAPGGHNVIAGLFDGLKAMNKDSQLVGFLGGPSGMIDNEIKPLDAETVDRYRNTGGFDMICSGRTKLESDEQFAEVAENCRGQGIQAVVVIGGDDSNTNACMLAEYFCRNNIDVRVVGCPKTIDGDLKNEQIETSFGFDTATKVYSELIGNIQRDANSAQKYWHFIKLMGRSASHIALECALKTHANVTLISEEVAAKKQTLQQIANHIAEVISKRAEKGLNFGVVLVPEGLIEFIPEMKALISELNDLLAENGEYFQSLQTTDDKMQFVNSRLSAASSQAFSSLPGDIQAQLLQDRDPHGNVQVSRIETEELLIDLVGDILREWQAKNIYSGKFSSQNHFFGYEGRCAAPSNFDADYCYSIGYTAACLAECGKTGYMASVSNLHKPATEWEAGGIPLTMMMNMERRKGTDHPVIRKALVELDGGPFKKFAANRDKWEIETCYLYPGPIQYFGPAEVADQTSETLMLEH